MSPAGSDESERQEFERFFVATSRALVGQAFVLTGDLQEAQDLAQDALTQAWRHWHDVRAYEDPAGWARRVLHNLAISRWRRSRVRFRHETRPVREPSVAGPDVAMLDVVAALRLLPVGQRRALVLHDVVGLTADEIARELGVPPGTARGWLHRARRTVAAELGWSDDPDHHPQTEATP